MFNRREVGPNSITNPELILAHEIAGELISRYEYTRQVKITHAAVDLNRQKIKQ
jgi:hypothetical protein